MKESFFPLDQRRRIKTEEQAMVVTAVWGTELIQFLTSLTILHQDDKKKGMISSYSSHFPGAIHPIILIVLVQNCWRDKKLNQFCPPKQQLMTFAFSSIFILLLCIGHLQRYYCVQVAKNSCEGKDDIGKKGKSEHEHEHKKSEHEHKKTKEL